jgi:hypothetical protein
MTKTSKKVALILLIGLLLNACAYIVTPESVSTPTSTVSKGWSAFVTKVGASDSGDLHVDITIRNETADWSVMQALADKPAVLTTSDGKTTNCETVFVGTGGNYLAPGFQMSGYTAGTKMKPETQLLYVECKGAKAEAGSKLKINYSYSTGNFNYYVTPKSTNADFDLNLDKVVTDLQYPVAQKVDGLIEKSNVAIEAINQCKLSLKDVKRTDTGLELSWENSNASQSPTYVHIGKPPVIDSKGIIYGFYESPHLADAPITPVNGVSDWTTTVTVPSDATGLYLLVSVESKQQRLFISHVIDISDK